MRDGVTNMDDGTGENMRLRRYLLGNFDDDAELAEIEMLFLKDDDFADKVAAVENALIEEFLDDDLDATERTSFVKHFLASPERRRQLRLTKGLREYSARSLVSSQPERSHSRSHPRLSASWLRLGAVALVVAAAAFGVWRFAIYRSDTDKGLAELRQAYAGTRPTESRTSAILDYAPYTVTRGPSPATSDQAARDRAERFLMDAVSDGEGARAHQDLALLYLAEKKFDRAQQEFSLAIAAAPNDAVIQSDAAAAAIETAKSLDAQKDGSRILNLLNESLKRLDTAISLDPRLPEARFNRALCLEMLKDTEQAKLAWAAYLELDPNSKWADEVRQRLQALGTGAARERSAEDLESEFINAFRAGDDASAAALAGENRELIRDKYLPTRLATSYLNAPDDRRDELLRALEYAGNIEKGLTGDPYSNDIAHFYAAAPESSRISLTRAQGAVRDGFRACLDQQYQQGVTQFDSAARLFAAAGDTPEAELARYFAAYARFNTKDNAAALTQFENVKEFAVRNGYRWLEALTTHYIGNSNVLLGQPTKARFAYEHALSIAVSIRDNYSVERNRIELARLHTAAGQTSVALRYLFEVMNADAATGSRQRYRNLSVGATILSNSELGEVGVANALEAVHAADLTMDEGYTAEARNYAGLAYTRVGNDKEARRWFAEGVERALAIGPEVVRSNKLAFLNINLGELELKSGDVNAAQQHFADAAKYFDSIGPSFFGETAHTGLLQTFLKEGNREALETQIPENIRLTEQQRSRVQDDAQRASYFESKQSIYDIAADFEFGRGNLEASYDYAEMASSRMLLERMEKSDRPASRTAGSADANISARPLGVSVIREKMPADVQIVKYSVLREKILIWVVSKDKFDVVPVTISASETDRMAKEFAQSLSRPSQNDEGLRLAKEFYDLLIAPVRDRLDPARQTCLIPDKGLFNVSFAALVSPDGSSPLAAMTIFFAPSTNAFLRSTETAEKRAVRTGETLLAIGDPAFDRTRFEMLPNVADAAAEARAVAAMYGTSTPLIGREATKNAFVNGIAAADVVHFAGHYVTRPGTPLSSFLLFAGEGEDTDRYTLTSGELLEMKLPRTRLVVLSACQTGVEGYLNSEGMVGMSRTLLADGVPVVVASLWNVDSQATAELMTRFHRYRLEPGTNSAAALRRAQLDIATDPTGRFRDPYYWAGFAVFGGSAKF